jgi:cell division protein FtsB
VTVRAEAATGTRVRLTGRAAFLIAAVTLLALLAVGPARAYLSQRGQIRDLQRQVQVLEGSNATLQRQVTRLHDPVELERLARQCLGRGDAAPRRPR